MTQVATWDDLLSDLEPYDRETLAVSSGAAVGLTLSKYNPASGSAAYCSIDVEGSAVRYWEDGTAPTPTTGLVLNPGDRYEIMGSKIIQQVKFVAISGSAILQVQYWR